MLTTYHDHPLTWSTVIGSCESIRFWWFIMRPAHSYFGLVLLQQGSNAVPATVQAVYLASQWPLQGSCAWGRCWFPIVLLQDLQNQHSNPTGLREPLQIQEASAQEGAYWDCCQDAVVPHAKYQLLGYEIRCSNGKKFKASAQWCWRFLIKNCYVSRRRGKKRTLNMLILNVDA